MKHAVAITTENPRGSYRYREVVSLLPQHHKQLLLNDRAHVKEDSNALFNWIMRYGRRHLDATTLIVFQFIYWRSYAYHKRAELIPKSHFLNGVWEGEDGFSKCAPATTSEHTLYKALNILEQCGFIDWYSIQVNGVDVTSLYEINFKNVIAHQYTEKSVSKLRESRKKTAKIIDFPGNEPSILDDDGRCIVAPTPPVHSCTTEDINKNEDIKNLSCSVPRNAKRITRSRKLEINCNDTALTSIEKAVARVTERRESKVRRAAAPGAGFISLVDLNATWQSVMIETFGSCTFSGLTHTEYGIFKRIAKAHTMSCTWREFLLWTVQNWSLINTESRELDAYKKKKSGDWSLADEGKILLGSTAPDIFRMTRNYVKLLKRFSQHTLAGHTVRPEESAEIIELRKVVAQVKKESAVSNQLLQKALSVKPTTVPTPKAVRAVKIVNPNNDTFFADTDSSLPEWK